MNSIELASFVCCIVQSLKSLIMSREHGLNSRDKGRWYLQRCQKEKDSPGVDGCQMIELPKPSISSIWNRSIRWSRYKYKSFIWPWGLLKLLQMTAHHCSGGNRVFHFLRSSYCSMKLFITFRMSHTSKFEIKRYRKHHRIIFSR